MKGIFSERPVDTNYDSALTSKLGESPKTRNSDTQDGAELGPNEKPRQNNKIIYSVSFQYFFFLETGLMSSHCPSPQWLN